MLHDRDVDVTGVVVIARGALRRAAWEVLLAQQPGLIVAGTASDVAELTEAVSRYRQSAILADGMGTDARRAAELVEAAHGTGVLWLLEEVDLPNVVDLLRAGVLGCLAVDSSASQLARAIVAVGRGEIALPASVAAPALAALARPIVADRRTPDQLTAREREVVGLLVQGLTNKDIAQTTFLSVRTVEAHLRSIYAKLDVRSRTEAVLWAVAHHRGNGQ